MDNCGKIQLNMSVQYREFREEFQTCLCNELVCVQPDVVRVSLGVFISVTHLDVLSGKPCAWKIFSNVLLSDESAFRKETC